MSDIDPDLPDWLVEAVLSQEPPAEAVDLVKDAWTWRTIDAELMELTYDSVLDEAGVRDASARRTMEFTAGDISVVIEIDGRTIRGTVAAESPLNAALHIGEASVDEVSCRDGRFELSSQRSGVATIVVTTGVGAARSPAFVIA